MLFLSPRGSRQQQRVLQLCGQGLPGASDTDPLPLRALVATLNCPLMWSFSVFVYGIPRKFRKRTGQRPRWLRKPLSRCLTGP